MHVQVVQSIKGASRVCSLHVQVVQSMGSCASTQACARCAVNGLLWVAWLFGQVEFLRLNKFDEVVKKAVEAVRDGTEDP